MSDDEQSRQILEARAAALSAVRKSRRERAGEVALFQREGVRYAIDAHCVLEVARVVAPTPLPLTPSHWLGLSSWHGELLGIVDLPRLLAEEAPSAEARRAEDEDEPQLVLVVGRERAEFGLLIDEVLEGRALGELVPLGSHESGTARGLLGGATPDGVRLVVAEALLADQRLFLPRAHADQPEPS